MEYWGILLPTPFQTTRRLAWHADKPVAQLTEADVNKFFEIGAANVPEAFQAFYAQASAAGETFVLKGGCKGLQVVTAAEKQSPCGDLLLMDWTLQWQFQLTILRWRHAAAMTFKGG